MSTLLLLSLLACRPPEVPAGTDTAAGSGARPGDSGDAIPEPEHVFTYAIVADPHVVDDGAHAERLSTAVAAINALPPEQSPELVFILGDIAWGNGWSSAYVALDALRAPWIPVLGDNPIQAGEETGFEDTFSSHLDRLGAQLPLIRANVPSPGPMESPLAPECPARLEGRAVVALDLNTRPSPPDGVSSQTLDLPGGTLPFLSDALETTPDGPEDRVVLLFTCPWCPVSRLIAG